MLLADTLGAVRSAYRYTSRGELDGYRVVANGETLLATGYGRDNLGRIVQLFDTTQGMPSRWSFVYDSLGRLAADSVNGAIFHVFTYDDNGNRLTFTSTSGTVSYGYDIQDRLLAAGSTGFTYGSNGELRTKTVPTVGTTSYTYDAFGNLVTVILPSGNRIDYVIDGQNRRVGRKVNGVLVEGWLYQNRLNPAAALDGNGNLVSRFIYASRINVPDYIVKGGIAYRLVSDHLGSVRLMVDAATGTVVQRIDYDEWGNVTLNTNPGFQPFGFAGGLFDDSTRLVRFGARDYDAAAGRWTTKDPIQFAGRDPNLYAYVVNDPINHVDPSGLFVWDLIDVGFFLKSLHDFIECPSWGTFGDLALDAAGLLPGIPSVGVLDEAADAARKLLNSGGDARRFTDDQRALQELVEEASHGGRTPLSAEDAETVLDWAKETGYPGVRAGPGDLASPSNWNANPVPHIHVPGTGRGGHVPVAPGVKPRP